MVGGSSLVTKLAADVTETVGAPPVVKSMVTVFSPTLTDPITSFKEVVLVPITQDPTELAVQVADASCDEEMKFEPVTVMVLPV